MQHKEWQEKIPFYVAQSLSPDETHRFEAHLAECEYCQQEIDDWRMIASAVWRAADESTRDVPPLSPEIYNRLSNNNTARGRYANQFAPSQTNLPDNIKPMPQRRMAVPVTLVAGILVAVFFGGLLMMLALRTPQQDGQIEVAIGITETTPLTEQAGVLMQNADDTTSPTELGIIPTIVPPQPTNTPLPPPTNVPSTPDPLLTPQIAESNATADLPLGGGLPESALSQPADEASAAQAQVQPSMAPSLTIAPTTTPLPRGGGPFFTVTPGVFAEGIPFCEATNPTRIPIELFIRADANTEIAGVLMPGAVYQVIARSLTGWYLVERNDGGEAWLQSNFAYLRGNCLDVLPFATVVPTATRISATRTPVATPINADAVPQQAMIAVVNAAYADFYQGPNFNSQILGVAVRDDQFNVLGYQGTGNDRWILVSTPDGTQAWLWGAVITEYTANNAP